MKKPVDLTNKKFGKWTALEYVRLTKTRAKWRCLCSCGTERLIWAHDLKSGRTRNCGCVRKTHGMTYTPEFEVWLSIIKRCRDKKNKNYGGRGIYVCARWRASFNAFYEDMGTRPPGMQIDRIDNDGPYSPNNCRWATRSQNMNNRSICRHITYRGHKKTVAEWSHSLGAANYWLVGLRLKKGWSIEDALTLPPNRRRQRKPLISQLRSGGFRNI